MKDQTATAGEANNSDPEEEVTAPVTVRKYSFDKNGNRTSLATTVDGTQTAYRSWSYDAADRVGVSDGYVYDGLGRQTTVPPADTPRTNNKAAGEGAITIGYYDDDAARSITRDGVTTTINRDPAGRRVDLTTGLSNEVKHYTDDSDSPAWSTRTEGGTNEVLTRYESTIEGDLALTITNGQVELAINNPHGDTVTTVSLTGDEAGQGIKGWAQFDEYGNQLTDTVATGATTYGWHGADQRALDTSGLILMGARLYNSATGLFTSRDPVPGGNSTAYVYPQNPIGANDISGEWGWWDTIDTVLTVASFIPGVNVVAAPLRVASAVIRVARVATKAYRAVKTVRRAKAAVINPVRKVVWKAQARGHVLRAKRLIPKGLSGPKKYYHPYVGRKAVNYWVGKGATSSRSKPGKIFISANKQRQGRHQTWKKPTSKYPGAWRVMNLESRPGSKGDWKSDYHINIRRPR